MSCTTTFTGQGQTTNDAMAARDGRSHVSQKLILAGCFLALVVVLRLTLALAGKIRGK